jgi:hypothetical protein
VVLVARLCLSARQRFSAFAIDRPERQKVLGTNPGNRTIEHRGTRRPFADLSRNCRRQLCIDRLAHQTEGLLDLLVRDNAEKGRLFQLHGEPLPQCAVEHRVTRGIDEIREHYRVLFGENRFAVNE